MLPDVGASTGEGREGQLGHWEVSHVACPPSHPSASLDSCGGNLVRPLSTTHRTETSVLSVVCIPQLFYKLVIYCFVIWGTLFCLSGWSVAWKGRILLLSVSPVSGRRQ